MAAMDKLKIAIVVLNYNGRKDTLECIQSLAKIKKDNFLVETIVVDNGSDDGSAKALVKLRGIKLILNDRNLGYSGGNNVGIKKALSLGADYIFILNNDTLVDKNILINLVHAASAGDIISPKIYFAPGFEFHKERYSSRDRGKVIWYAGGAIDWANIIGRHLGVDEVDKGQFARRRQIDLATGAAVFVGRSVFEKTGLFDEKYFLYLEDMDFCVRAKKTGFKIIFEPAAIVWHKNASSSGGSGSPLQDYFITRNRLLFAARYAKLKTKLAVLRQILGQINQKTKRMALLDFVTFNFGKGSFIK